MWMSDSSCHIYANNSVLVIRLFVFFVIFGTQPSTIDVTCRNELPGLWRLAGVGHNSTAVTPGGRKSVLHAVFLWRVGGVRLWGSAGRMHHKYTEHDPKGGPSSLSSLLSQRTQDHQCFSQHSLKLVSTIGLHSSGSLQPTGSHLHHSPPLLLPFQTFVSFFKRLSLDKNEDTVFDFSYSGWVMNYIF